MCNLYSITTNQAAIAALFRVVNRYVGNLAPMPGVFPDYPAPVVRNSDTGREPLHLGDAASRLRRCWLHGLSSQDEASIDGRLIHDHQF